MNTQPRIMAQEVSYTYEDAENPALQNLSVSVAPGEFVAVLGHNGSGKSTFAKLLNALYIPSGGKLLVCGLDTQNEDNVWDVRQHAGMIFQNPDNQLVATVVREDVAFGLENLGVPTDEMIKRIDAALEAVHMTEFAASAPHTLSGGQKQRVAIAGVLAMEPEILIADEATAMLDPDGRQEVLRTIRRLHTQQHKTVVMITHYIEEAIGADRVYLIHNGKMIADGTAREMLTQPELLAAAGLTPPMPVQMYYDLKQAGIVLARCPLTLEELAEELCRSQ